MPIKAVLAESPAALPLCRVDERWFGGEVWPVLLAGGDGTRLRGLTSLASGAVVPKQFCSLLGPTSLLLLALRRANRLAPLGRTLAVLAAAHRGWWHPQLSGLPSENLLVQPANRGTAPAVLLAAREVARRDPGGIVVLLPTDHFVEREDLFAESLALAVRNARAHADRMVLVGLRAAAPETSYGWIVEGPAANGVRPVARFVEKPDAPTAEALFRAGAYVNSFLVAASAQALLAAFAEHLPALHAELGPGAVTSSASVASLYRRIGTLDFSREVLQRSANRLALVVAPRCGWSDLGTPERVAACLLGAGPGAHFTAPPPAAVAPLELASSLRGPLPSESLLHP